MMIAARADAEEGSGEDEVQQNAQGGGQMEEESEFKLETKDLKEAMGLGDEEMPVEERKEETKEGVTVEASQLAKTKTKKKPAEKKEKAPKKEKVDPEIKKKEKADLEAKKKEKAEADAKKKADKAEAAAKK